MSRQVFDHFVYQLECEVERLREDVRKSWASRGVSVPDVAERDCVVAAMTIVLRCAREAQKSAGLAVPKSRVKP
jgi:hypothetical protein